MFGRRCSISVLALDERSDQRIAYIANGVTFGTPGTQVFDTATLTIFGYAAYEVRA